MIESELQEFFEFIKSKEIIIIEGYEFDSENVIPSTKPFRSIFTDNEKILLVNKHLFYSYKPQFIEGRDKWIFPLFETPFIELTFPKRLNKSKIVNGRLFTKIGWLDLDSDNKIHNSSYRKLERWIKKRCLKIKDTWWVSEEIKKWSLETDGELLFGIGSSFSRKLNINDFES